MKLFLASVVALSNPIGVAVDSNTQLPGCGDSSIDKTLSPSFGSEMGGVTVQITVIETCLDEGINVYCRFNYTVVDSIRLSESIIECVSPPSNGELSMEVSYAVYDSGSYYDPDDVEWNSVIDLFDYDGDLASVIITPTFGDTDNTRLIFAERTYKAQWNSNALLLSAIASDTVSSSFTIDLEVVAYVGNDPDQYLRFQVVQTLEISSNDINVIELIVDDDDIVLVINSYKEGIAEVGFLIVRVVAHTETSGLRRVHTTRTSKLIRVLPADTDTTINTCLVAPFDDCNHNFDDIPPPCPFSYEYTENDLDFELDETCVYPSGSKDCVVASNIDVDHVET